MKASGKSWYMHTIDGQPAYFSKRNEQIVYIFNDGTYGETGALVPTLKQIRREQARTRRNRAAWGMGDEAGKYDYVRFAK